MLSATKKILKSYVTSYEAANMLGVTMRTVQLWADSGLLTCWKTEGGHRRILRDSVERLLVDRGSLRTDSNDADLPDQEVATEKLRILVVEDDPLLVRLYRMRLTAWSLAPEVLCATNGIEGLVVLGKRRPDLLIADLNMPEMDGFRMLRVLCSMPELDATAIVVVTGLDAGDVAERGGLPERIVLLPKPIPFAELEKIAMSVAERSGYGRGTEK